jgi:hypothetical protein
MTGVARPLGRCGSVLGELTSGVLCIALMFAFACARPARADWHARTKRDGLGVSAGFGSHYGGIGGQATYWLQWGGSLFRLAAYGGVGLISFEHG